jgi:exopolyphosphatase/guanosine-5'-triphosphate,3'-diphosphate pyrophosphatase
MVIGLALRLAFCLTAGVPGVLSQSEVRLLSDQVVVSLPGSLFVLAGEVPKRRLDALAKAMGRSGAFVAV